MTGIHPAPVLIARIAGARAGGVIGVLVAVPLMIVVIVLLEEFQGRFVGTGDKASAEASSR
ncbi:AI-2E family transporter [Aggregatilinea lenta]|uniref:AI-2E family transporter n=1 Tax=Aggregatilinea lenta TaxID=913108 RepID=UPI000E5BAFC1|nr:AI-2E family transporter [Aggregatilinea lenta]